MFTIGIKADLKPLHRAMIDLGAKQVPFAMSLALNTLAKGVAADQVELIDETFDTPTPFTEKAYRIEVATKAKPIARVAAKDIQASYLEPYVIGGKRSLGTKRGMLAPRGVNLNQYGNLTKGTIGRLKGRPNVFVGAVKTRKGGTINGVWQRQPARRTSKGASPAGPLKLLVQFEDTTPVPKRLPFEQRARAYLKRHAAAAFNDALRRALATSRR
jgi:hypothetical protein